MSTGFILTRGRGTGSSTASTPFGTKTAVISIPPGETRDLDTIPFTTYAVAKWLVAVMDIGETLLQSYEVHGQYLASAASPSHTTFSQIGDKIHNQVNVVNVASTLVIRVTNNESYTINVKAARYDVNT